MSCDSDDNNRNSRFEILGEYILENWNNTLEIFLSNLGTRPGIISRFGVASHHEKPIFVTDASVACLLGNSHCAWMGRKVENRRVKK